MKIDKETFVNTIDKIQKLWEYENRLSVLNEEYGFYVQQDGYSLVDTVIDLLDLSLTPEGSEQIHDDVAYFIYETDFGKKILERKSNDDIWVIEENGVDVSDNYTSAEKLFDYLSSL